MDGLKQLEKILNVERQTSFMTNRF